MNKAMVVTCALDGYRRADEWMRDRVRFKNTFNHVIVAFTEDCPQGVKDETKRLFDEIITAVGDDDRFGKIDYVVAKMSVVTTETELWEPESKGYREAMVEIGRRWRERVKKSRSRRDQDD